LHFSEDRNLRGRPDKLSLGDGLFFQSRPAHFALALTQRISASGRSLPEAPFPKAAIVLVLGEIIFVAAAFSLQWELY
jgi:hypothetical protein